jgi:hypothetical protein
MDRGEAAVNARLRMPDLMDGARRGRLGILVLAGVVLLAAGGAAAVPGGWLLGLPTLPVAGAVALAALALGSVAPERGRLALGLAPLLALVLLGAPLPGVRALTGGPLFALALAALVLAATTGSMAPWARRAFLPVVAVAYLVGAARVQQQVGPEGDEPHYLMVADSLIRDHDLELERDYAEGRYRGFHPAPLAPHYRVRGKTGEIYSLHAVGLSVLVLPAYWAFGYPGASFFMAGLAVLLAVELRRLLRQTLGDDPAAETTAWVLALSAPLVSYAGLVFTEVPAALGTTIVLRHGSRPEAMGPRALAGVGVLLAFLPWLNVRYGITSVLLAGFVGAGLLRAGRLEPRRSLALLLPLLASALGLALYHFALYGFFDPRRVYGRRPEFALATLREGLPGLLLDQEFGLLAYAPVFALALPGFVALWRRERRLALVAVSLVTAVALTAGTWHMWRGGFNPPARFLVPVLPALALAVGVALVRGVSAPAAVLMGFGLWTAAAGLAEPRLVHRDRDGTAPLFRAASGAEEWTRLLPGFVLQDPARGRLSVVWTAALLAAALWRGRGTARGLAGATLGLVAAAGTASALSSTPTGGRDAVRVLGRPAVHPPGLMVRRDLEARWEATALAWGPLHEPHRFPSGAPLGERLRLPAGGFELTVVAQVLDERHDPGHLRLRGPDRGSAASVPFQRVPEGLRAVFTLAAPDPDLTLVLEGGGAFLLKSLELRIQPAGP